MTFEDFSNRFLTVEFVGPERDDVKARNNWKVKIFHLSVGKEETFDFFTGFGISRPTPNDVLQSLHSDFRAANGNTLVEFAEEFSYTNIREADEIYRKCLSNGRKLRTVLGHSWNQFLQCTEDEN